MGGLGSPRRKEIMLNAEKDCHHQDLVKLRSWLIAMLERPAVADLGRALLMLLNEGFLAVFRPKKDPIFVIVVRHPADIAPVLDTLDHPVQIAVLRLCAKRDVCFRIAFVNGQPDLKFYATMYELPNWRYTAKRLYPCGGGVQ